MLHTLLTVTSGRARWWSLAVGRRTAAIGRLSTESCLRAVIWLLVLLAMLLSRLLTVR